MNTSRPTGCAILAAALLSAAAPASAAVPGVISYQGSVADSSGAPLGAGSAINRTMIFRIYGSPTGNDLLYSEQQVVTIAEGDFNVLLGQGALVGSEPKPAIDTVFNGTERFLGVTVDDGTPAADPEISPRQQLASTGFAFRAKSADRAVSAASADSASSAHRVVSDGSDSVFNWAYVNNLTVQGHGKITGSNILEFGTGLTKEGSAGVIGYQRFSPGLDIVGAGLTGADRRITLWAEAGTDFRGPAYFGERLGQHINLFGQEYGIGIQSSTLYQRVSGDPNSGFAWFFGGGHHNDRFHGGGGAMGLALHRGGLWLPSGKLDMGGRHGPWVNSWGSGHEVGSQEYTTYFRSGPQTGSFAWYLGGSHTAAQNDPGGGARVATMDDGGMHIYGSRVLELGGGIAGKNGAGGHIAYQRYSDGLDIVGAGTADDSTRKVKIWAENVTEFTGRILAKGITGTDAILSGYGFVSGTLYVGGDHFGHPRRDSNINMTDWTIHAHPGSGFDFQRFGMLRAYVASDGSYIKTSDAELKKDIQALDGVLPNLRKLKPSTYRFKDQEDGEPLSYGFIAQEVQQVYPDFVRKHESGVLTLGYESFIPVAVAAIQEQQEIIDGQAAEIASLKKQLEEAQARDESQERRLAAIESLLKEKVLPASQPAAKTASR